MKPDQERVKNLLTDTVSLLCRNGLFFQDQLKIEGLIGITIDNNEVFLVPINNMFNNAGAESTPAAEEEAADVEEEVDESRAPSKPPSPSKVKKERSAEKFTHSTTNTPGRQSPTVKIKQEVVAEDDEDDDLIVVTKNEDCDSFQTSDQRVPPLHGTQGLPVPNLSSFDGMSGYTDSGLGEPPAKRRAGSSSRKHGSTSFSGFPQGLDSPLNQSQGSNSSWSNSNIPPELLAQMAEGQMNMDGSGAGCSTWPQQGGQPGADQMRLADLNWQGLVGSYKPRRSSKDSNKPYICLYPGCGRSFYHRQSLWSHKKGAGHRCDPPPSAPSAMAPAALAIPTVAMHSHTPPNFDSKTNVNP